MSVKKNIDFQKVAEEQLRKNVHVIESLRDYDAGKKDISVSIAEKHFPSLLTQGQEWLSLKT